MIQILPSGQGIEIVHFLYPVSRGEIIDWRVACMPNMVEFHPSSRMKKTDSVTAVTCPQCRHTNEFKTESAKQQAANKYQKNS